MSAVTMADPGLYTTIQDMGRPGWRAYGVTAGGAMDTYALRVANLLVGNDADSACLEFTLVGASFRADCDLLVAVTGAYMAPEADGAEVPMWRPVWLAAGTMLSLGRARAGCRTYVAAAGGFAVAPVLDGRGADVRAGFGGGFARPLAAGDTLPIGDAGSAAGREYKACAAAPFDVASNRGQRRAAAEAWTAAWAAALAQHAAAERRSWAAPAWFVPPEAYAGGDAAGGIELRAMPGSAFDSFTAESREQLFGEPYRLAPASDRMGCRLSGPSLERIDRAELNSRGIMPGAVQVPPGGQPIVLGADCQTTGGYPVIAHVATADLPLLAQAKPGDRLRFREITVAEAQRLDLQREASLRVLAAGLLDRLPHLGRPPASPIVDCPSSQKREG